MLKAVRLLMTQNCVMVSDELYKVFSSLIGYDLVCKIIVQESLQHLEGITSRRYNH